jgi:DNA-binding MarR family transcriptional regulator
MKQGNVTKTDNAVHLANLIFEMLPICQKKQEKLAEEHGLFHTEFKCLRLFGIDEDINNKEIAKRMNLSPSRLTRIMDGLVKKGYMKREIDGSDRRNMKLSLSRRGKILTNKINDAYNDIHAEILKEIEVDKHESLINSIEHLHTSVENWLNKN